jgi:RNA polymerase sigma-70 factor (ECF subfamily)
VQSDEQWDQSQPDEKSTAAPGLSLDLMKMLEILDDEDRAMLIMKYAEGHDYDELAGIFDMSVSACKMRISRAREKIQKAFPEGSS